LVLACATVSHGKEHIGIVVSAPFFVAIVVVAVVAPAVSEFIFVLAPGIIDAVTDEMFDMLFFAAAAHFEGVEIFSVIFTAELLVFGVPSASGTEIISDSIVGVVAHSIEDSLSFGLGGCSSFLL
jgi:hypothetical protein